MCEIGIASLRPLRQVKSAKIQ